ncbi:MAG: DUF2062 domain-containing protein [Lentimicrobium sp.]|jgi:uncharacterized protein (DUF2062 family)|nr:DUF2062 domain-containing protein [Lentimicrobium sp.]
MKNDSKSIFKRKITHPLITFLRQGLTPETMSKTIASGLLIGTIPIPGTSTLLCTALSLGFRMNLGLIQLVNYLAFPLQLLLFVPFYNIASRITGRAFFSKITEITEQLTGKNWLEASSNLLLLMGTAVLVWLLIMFPISLLMYFIIKPVLTRLKRRGDLSD